jgi:hypothetical protein
MATLPKVLISRADYQIGGGWRRLKRGRLSSDDVAPSRSPTPRMYNSRRASSSATVSALIMPRSAYARLRAMAKVLTHTKQNQWLMPRRPARTVEDEREKQPVDPPAHAVVLSVDEKSQIQGARPHPTRAADEAGLDGTVIAMRAANSVVVP